MFISFVTHYQFNMKMSFVVNIIICSFLIYSCETFQFPPFEDVFHRQRAAIRLSKEEMADLIPNMVKGVDIIRHIDVNGFMQKRDIHKLGSKDEFPPCEYYTYSGLRI